MKAIVPATQAVGFFTSALTVLIAASASPWKFATNRSTCVGVSQKMPEPNSTCCPHESPHFQMAP
jgi:hypothetical protein